MTSRITHLVLIAAFLVVPSGCQKRQAPEPTASVMQAGQPPVSDPVTITDDKGGCVGTITPGGAMQVAVGCGSDAQVFFGKSHAEGKRKYYDANRNLVLECKSDDSGMKVKAADGRLLWKVSWAHEAKLKISDNEEGGHPIELRAKHNRVDVDDSGRLLGQVVFHPAQGEAQVSRAAGGLVFVLRGSASSPAFGLMLADRIPMVERLVLQAELLARGR